MAASVRRGGEQRPAPDYTSKPTWGAQPNPPRVWTPPSREGGARGRCATPVSQSGSQSHRALRRQLFGGRRRQFNRRRGIRNLSRNLERINGCGRVIDWLSVDPDGLSVESPPDGLSIVSPPDGLSIPYRLFIKYWFHIDYWFRIDSVLSPPAPEQRLLPEYI